ncbi:oxalurate catabolism protein HpxZ [Oxalicibacterium flavum]|nr:oxalurate catabolism protein HpxZ [Oxalicibacterium flavum]
MMDINLPITLQEVEQAFDAYEKALVGNDVSRLDQLFWNDANTLRYGATENLVGYDEIRAFRLQRPAANLVRTVTSRHVTTFGTDFAVANITFTKAGETRVGRQTQTWVKFADGWHVVAAHVSWMDGK